MDTAAFEHLRSLPFPRLQSFVAAEGPVSLRTRYEPEPWVALTRVVIGQQVSTAAAQSIWRRVENAAGSNLDELILHRNEDLAACGLSRAKQRTLTELFTAKQAGKLDLPELALQTHQDRLDALTPYWGIGPWSVEMFSLFHCLDGNIWSPGDLALQKGAEGFSEGKTADLIGAAAPFRSYLALYCWRAANARLFG